MIVMSGICLGEEKKTHLNVSTTRKESKRNCQKLTKRLKTYELINCLLYSFLSFLFDFRLFYILMQNVCIVAWTECFDVPNILNHCYLSKMLSMYLCNLRTELMVVLSPHSCIFIGLWLMAQLHVYCVHCIRFQLPMLVFVEESKSNE